MTEEMMRAAVDFFLNGYEEDAEPVVTLTLRLGGNARLARGLVESWQALARRDGSRWAGLQRPTPGDVELRDWIKATSASEGA